MSQYATTATEHVARKAHRCSWCWQRIPAGESYSRYRYYNGGEAGSVKAHPECYAAIMQASSEEGGYVEWTPGMERPAKPPKVYLSGPMTGIADLNAPAFAAEAARLLALGYQVENPADVVLPDGATWADFMRADIPRLLACTHIRMLDGWTMSKGARLEHHIAISLGLEVLTDCDLQEQK